MLKNYFKIAWRTIIKDKSFTAINLLGLASGLAITLMIVQYVRFELSYEDVYPKADQIVRVTTDIYNGESLISQDCETYPPMAAMLKAEIPEVSNSTRAYPFGDPAVDVEINNKQYTINKVFAVDSSFFDIFDFQLLAGTKKGIMTGLREVVLTEKLAMSYFNTTNAVGKTLNVIRNKGKTLMTVVAVVPDSPANTHLKFDMLVSYPTMFSDFGERENNWSGNNTLTYLELNKNADYDKFVTGLNSFTDRLHEKDLATDEQFIGQKIGDIHLYSKKDFETEPNNDAQSVYLLLIIAFLVIISALVNYVNLTTSKALDRAKEMGMRKVVGSTQSQIKAQVFIESILINVSAGVLAIVLIITIKDIFIETAGLPTTFSIFSDSFFWLSLVVFISVSILLSAIYPAYVLSSFKPSSVLKGSFSHSKKGTLLRKSLVVFQFGITIILMVQAYAVYNQLHFLRDSDIGINTEKTIVINAPQGEGIKDQFNSFKQNLLANSKVSSVAVSSAVPGQPEYELGTTTGINLAKVDKETNYNFYLNVVDSAYFDLMEISVIAGSNFNSNTVKGINDDETNEVIVNEEALRLWGIPTAKEAIGQELNFWDTRTLIIGVVKNYNQLSPKLPQIPMIHIYSPNNWDVASIKFNSGGAQEQLETVKAEYAKVFPGKPISYFFLDTKYDQQYKADERFQRVFGALTLFAIFIACLGLFGLATFTVVKRTKEIGIRKSIGASTSNVLLLLSKDFVKTVLFSMLIGIPISYLLVNKWLENFANHMEVSWWLFALPSVLILLLVIISISGKTITTALMNPVDSLRSE
ncbi:putative ABC transport system permease protein [Spirosomataceae bacterium TFI 002]|nr:putative ABC transport system permease protein [Spirosomataceae bacterium TFI 002]